MAAPLLIALPYRANPCDWFARIRHLAQPVLLDSCHEFSGRGRYDIIAASPSDQFTINCNQSARSLADDALALERLLNTLTPVENPQQLPFTGGLIGWISYEAGYPQHQLSVPARSDHQLPDLQMGIYRWAVINDHQQQCSYLVAHPDCEAIKIAAIEQLLLKEPTPSANQPFNLTSNWKSNLDREAYGKAFNNIHNYIRDGDCYQINLAQRFAATFLGDSWQAYQQLRPVAAAPFSAFIPTEQGAILSLSPETFLRFEADGKVESSPIKGTAPRHENPKDDKKIADELIMSAKNRAENLMIVDLLRNDLGQCCEAGSINVDELFALESFATVHHLVSKISGQLCADIHPLTMLGAAFPGGSITGAPKKRAMEIIHELEPHQRSIYCGGIGYLSRDGRGEFNIAIRTLLAENNNIYCWAGGGIVSDSKEDEEYQESLSKIHRLLNTLNP